MSDDIPMDSQPHASGMSCICMQILWNLFDFVDSILMFSLKIFVFVVSEYIPKPMHLSNMHTYYQNFKYLNVHLIKNFSIFEQYHSKI